MDDIDPRGSDRRTCEHNWQPVSMVFETQLLDDHGRVRVRQPDINAGRVYLVCPLCASHTYMSTKWVGHRLYGSEDQHDDGTWIDEEDEESSPVIDPVAELREAVAWAGHDPDDLLDTFQRMRRAISR